MLYRILYRNGKQTHDCLRGVVGKAVKKASPGARENVFSVMATFINLIVVMVSFVLCLSL